MLGDDEYVNELNTQVSQVPESSEGKSGHRLDLVTFNEPAKGKNMEFYS